MSGVKKTLFGSPSKSKSRTSPLFTGTDFSSRDGGKISFDPSIRSLQESGIDSAATGQREFGQAVGRFGGELGELKSRLFTNQDPFTQARTAATEERFAGERGALQRDIGRRGLGGSSFGQQAQTTQASQQERELNNQRALATQESIQAGVSIDQLILQAEQALAAGNFDQANLLRGIADDRARLESGVMLATNQQNTTTGGSTGLVGAGIGLAGAASALGARPFAPKPPATGGVTP